MCVCVLLPGGAALSGVSAAVSPIGRYLDNFKAFEISEDPDFMASCTPKPTIDYNKLPSCKSQPSFLIADGGFEEPIAVRDSTYCDAGGDFKCTHVLLPRFGEQIVGFQSTTSNKGRSFETHYADTFEATGTAPLHSCTLGQQDGAKIGVRIGATRRASIASRSALRRTPCNLDQ